MKFRITKGRTLSRRALDNLMQERLPRLGECGRTLDIGGKHSPYRRLLQSRGYWTLDIVARLKPDVVGDAHLLPIADGALDTVIASQTLEHCQNPQRVVCETRRALRRGGRAVFSVPFAYVIHGDPSDYWRFTRFALEELFRGFASVEIVPYGNQWASAWDLATANRSLLRYLNYILYWLSFSRDDRCPCGYLVIATK
jgi:SAM-dependent methyltransferase